ncbi:superoxide dismutase [Mumia sp. zg.B21]|uniref:SMP-30/gluconolactonase/LRE family protein n=1 Tax=Mumia sp. zg.B21 TaxID=2855447 RepID=UPI001C6EA39B|nr:superoxide dismutase [Mumia sp. zg.B21]MBW9208944.1 superoxide dismutase [Mumia sp. zg.B21]
MRTRRLVLAIALAVGAAVLSPTTSVATATPRAFPAEFPLPDGFQPEGIAIGPGPTAWFGSLADGDIYQVDLRTGRGEVISQGPGTAAAGLKSDRRGRLYVAGGPSGTGRIVDTRTGATLASYPFTTGAGFVNDVVLTRRTAWFTDSLQPQLYGVPLRRGGRPADPDDVVTLPLSGDWQQGTGFGANGLTETPDGRALLVVLSERGELHRVDTRTGRTRIVDLGGYVLTNGDGMLLQGRTLYVVQNRLNTIAVFRLDRRGTTGRLVDQITSPRFDVPTTVAAFGPWLYLPNARFGTPPTPQTPYWVTRVPRTRR